MIDAHFMSVRENMMNQFDLHIHAHIQSTLTMIYFICICAMLMNNRFQAPNNGLLSTKALKSTM